MPFDPNNPNLYKPDLGEVEYPVFSDEDETEPKRKRRTGKETPEHLARAARCQNEHWRVPNPLTGGYYTETFACGYHDCLFCGQKYATKLEERITSRNHVFYIELPHTQAIRARKLIADRYLYASQPTVTTSKLFIKIDANFPWTAELDELLAARVPCDHAMHLTTDWFALQNVPDGHNASGKLGKEPELDEELPATVEIVVPRYLVSETPATDTAKLDPELTSIWQTINETPTTAKELQESLYRRFNVLTHELDAQGIKYQVLYTRRQVNLDKLAWWVTALETALTILARGVANLKLFLAQVRLMFHNWSDKVIKQAKHWLQHTQFDGFLTKQISNLIPT